MLPRHPAESNPAAATEPGGGRQLLRSRYELGEVLGRGGMAEVRIGIDRRLGRTVAVKTLRADLASDPTFQARFRREAQSAAGLNHPSIVAVYDTGDGVVDRVSVPYIVMEYVEGWALRDVLRERGRILPERALEITADICDALEFSHRAGIVHRDIKPANVMLTPNGDVKVMDFGIARAVTDATMTGTAAVIGTAEYMSPEQAGGERVDARSDVYATGCLLYELLTGRPPFVGDSPVSVAYQHVRETPRPPSMLDPELSEDVDAITLMSLQKNPLDRYQSAAEMRQDIERGLSGHQVAAFSTSSDTTDRFLATEHPAPVPANAPLPVRDRQTSRGRNTAGCAMVVFTLLVLLGIVAFIGFRALALSSKEGPRTVLAPTLINETEREARAILAEENLELGGVEKRVSDSVPKGQVIAQDPKPGQPVPVSGGTVNITVSGGKATLTVPNVTGMQLAEAKAQLAAKGLKAKQEKDNKSTERKGTVTSTLPYAGAPAAEGDTITLFYATGLEEVPYVLQETEDVAETTLDDAGFDARTVYEETTDAIPGTVINQTPGADTMHQPGSTITIVVATQPPPQPEPTPTESPADDWPPTDTPTPSESPTELPDED